MQTPSHTVSNTCASFKILKLEKIQAQITVSKTCASFMLLEIRENSDSNHTISKTCASFMLLEIRENSGSFRQILRLQKTATKPSAIK